MFLVLAVLLCLSTGLASAGPVDNPAYVRFASSELEQGREIWIGTCEGCHGYGIAGAPIPMVPDEWEGRLKKPRDVLYGHAIDGFFGPNYTQMPARGGNDSLTDEQVRAAVDYMVALAEHYLKKMRTSR